MMAVPHTSMLFSFRVQSDTYGVLQGVDKLS